MVTIACLRRFLAAEPIHSHGACVHTECHLGEQSPLEKLMKHVVLIVSALAVATLSAADEKKTVTGTITDTMCAKGSHGVMRMGPTDADCAKGCATVHGARFVFYDGTNVYTLSDQKASEKVAGQKVKIVGIVDAKGKTIAIESIAPPAPPK